MRIRKKRDGETIALRLALGNGASPWFEAPNQATAGRLSMADVYWANAARLSPKNDGGLFEDGAIHGADGLFHHMPINCASELEVLRNQPPSCPNRTWVKSPNAVQGRGGGGGREGRGCGGEGVGALGGRQPLYL